MIVAAARTASGDLSDKSVSTARAAVVSQMNFGLDPLIVADPIGTLITDSNLASITKSSEAMGEMIRRVRDHMNRNSNGTVIDGNDVVAALADDISDGIVDGAGGNFSSGHDLGTPAQVADQKERGVPDDGLEFYDAFRKYNLDYTLKWRNLPKATIASSYFSSSNSIAPSRLLVVPSSGLFRSTILN